MLPGSKADTGKVSPYKERIGFISLLTHSGLPSVGIISGSCSKVFQLSGYSILLIFSIVISRTAKFLLIIV
jgi:membrane protein YqaA with SNARE-associated domain